jgi:nicotinamide-nucleotide amidase
MFETLLPAIDRIAQLLRLRGERLVTAESCTGGLIAAACTSVAGSSDWFERGYVTYSNAAKTESLGVPAALIAARGAVSEPVARAMAEGALQHARADWSLAVTGIAGPGGAVPGKPVGTVWLALGHRGHTSVAWLLHCPGDRGAVRMRTVERALAELLRALEAG